MKHMNESFPEDFILMGFTKYLWLGLPLFFALLISYMFTLLGNIAIILVSQIDPQLQSPMYFFLTSLFFWTSVSPAQLYPKSCSTGGAQQEHHLYRLYDPGLCISLAGLY